MKVFALKKLYSMKRTRARGERLKASLNDIILCFSYLLEVEDKVGDEQQDEEGFSWVLQSHDLETVFIDEDERIQAFEETLEVIT